MYSVYCWLASIIGNMFWVGCKSVGIYAKNSTLVPLQVLLAHDQPTDNDYQKVHRPFSPGSAWLIQPENAVIDLAASCVPRRL